MTPLLHRLVAALRESRLEDLLETLRLFFAKIPNTITLDHEKYYQTIFFTVFKLIGTARKAMEQIRKMRCFEPYLDDGRHVTLVGATFSNKKPGTWGNSW
ncbi:MAG: hypothetical protein WCQ50_14330 [Spirochaetota bacterium]